jgi:hypothetical protein
MFTRNRCTQILRAGVEPAYWADSRDLTPSRTLAVGAARVETEAAAGRVRRFVKLDGRPGRNVPAWGHGPEQPSFGRIQRVGDP